MRWHTFFNGSNFIVDKASLTSVGSPVISRWANASAGLDALLDPWNLMLGLAVMFLARILGTLYIINNVEDEAIRTRGRRQLLVNTVPFLAFFLAFFIRTLLKDGYAVNAETGMIFMEPMKYLHNYLALLADSRAHPRRCVAICSTASCAHSSIPPTQRGYGQQVSVWYSSCSVSSSVRDYNDTAFYPSNADLQSSLTIHNSCSSEFTLQTMAIVSVLVPFVFGYIAYVWRVMDRKK